MITLPPDLLERLRHIAAERKVSMAAVVREALEEKVSQHRVRPRSLRIGASGFTGTARQTAEERPAPRSWR
jgi:predicted transcriptional regulator